MKKSFKYEDYLVSYYTYQFLYQNGMVRKNLIMPFFYVMKDCLSQLVIGELRHSYDKCLSDKYVNLPMDRLACVDMLKDIDLDNLIDVAIEMFSYDWQQHYGGLKWLNIAIMLKEFHNCDINDYKRMTILLEKAIYLCHNGGLAFSKSNNLLVYASSFNSETIMDSFRDRNFYDAMQVIHDNYITVKIDRFLYAKLKEFSLGHRDNRLFNLINKLDTFVLLTYKPFKYGKQKLEILEKELVEADADYYSDDNYSDDDSSDSDNNVITDIEFIRR